MHIHIRGFSSLLGLLLVGALIIGGVFIIKQQAQAPESDQIASATSTQEVADAVTGKQVVAPPTPPNSKVVKELCGIPGVGKLTLINDGSYKVRLVSSDGKEIAVSEKLEGLIARFEENSDCFSQSTSEITVRTGYGDGGEVSMYYWVLSLPSLTERKVIYLSVSGGADKSEYHLSDGRVGYMAITEHNQGTGNTVTLLGSLEGSSPVELEKFENSQGNGKLEYTSSGEYLFTLLKIREDSELFRKVLPQAL